jgi:DNA end-binding protein Ku
MAPRPYWKGYLKLSLVACPVSVFTATTSSERVSFRQINRKTGNRLRQQLVDEETREVVDAADKVKGYEVDKGVYIQIEDEEIEALEIESNHTIDIDSFVPRAQIDERYLDSSYYIAPNDQVGREAFAVIREAMRGKDMVALGRIVLAKRERVIALQPWENGLLGTTLRYAYEVRSASEYFDEIPTTKVPKDMLELAEHILESKAGDFDPSSFTTKRPWSRC